MTYEWLLSKKDEGKQTHSFILLHTSHHMMDYETRGPWAQTCKKKKKDLFHRRGRWKRLVLLPATSDPRWHRNYTKHDSPLCRIIQESIKESPRCRFCSLKAELLFLMCVSLLILICLYEMVLYSCSSGLISRSKITIFTGWCLAGLMFTMFTHLVLHISMLIFAN